MHLVITCSHLWLLQLSFKNNKLSDKTRTYIEEHGLKLNNCKKKEAYNSTGVTSVKANLTVLICSFKKKEACLLNSWKTTLPIVFLFGNIKD